MKKKFRFRMSQSAHRRLQKKHAARSNGENSSFVKMSYHSRVHFLQEKKKRILTPEERKKEYHNVIDAFF